MAVSFHGSNLAMVNSAVAVAMSFDAVVIKEFVGRS